MSREKTETREAILSAALELLEKEGPEKIRVQDIADRAGISRQGLYLHFDSRTDLLLEVVAYADRSKHLSERSRSVWETSDAREALDRFVALNAYYTSEIYQIARVLMQGRYHDDDLAAAWEDRMRGRRKACRRLIEWMQEDGTLKVGWTQETTVDLLWTLTSVQVWEQLVVDRDWSPEQYEKHLQTVVEQTFLKQN